MYMTVDTCTICKEVIISGYDDGECDSCDICDNLFCDKCGDDAITWKFYISQCIPCYKIDLEERRKEKKEQLGIIDEDKTNKKRIKRKNYRDNKKIKYSSIL